ncbi:serine/threonine protein kinase, partial [Corynebacterium bovis]
WAGLTCRPATPEPGQRAKINCSGPSRAVALAEYDDASRRDDAVVLADPQRLSNGRCEVDSGTVGESGDVGVLPRGGGRDRFAILLTGDGASPGTLSVPVC